MRVVSALRRALDARLLPSDLRRVRAQRITYLSPAKLRRLDAAAKSAIRAADGDVLEFGVALGGSAVILAKMARAHRRRFGGFDVFAMIPPPTSEKDDPKSKARYEVIASGRSLGINGEAYYGYRDNLYDEVCATFDRHGVIVDGKQVQLVKGLFEDTWPTYAVEAIAFAHIDCDWYDPVKYCLESVAPKLSMGGVIVLDDYNDYGGCRTATDEFLDDNPQFEFEDGPNAILRRQK